MTLATHYMTHEEAASWQHESPYRTRCGRLVPKERAFVVSLRQQDRVTCRPCLLDGLREARDEASFMAGVERLLFKRCVELGIGAGK